MEDFYLDVFELRKFHASTSLELLKTHKNAYLGGDSEGILLDHIVCLKRGLEYLGTILSVSGNENLSERAEYSVSYVKQRLYSLSHLEEDESLVTNLAREYSDLREQMKSVIIKPGTEECDVIFPDFFTQWGSLGFVFSKILCPSLFEAIKELMTLECKADRINHMKKELEVIREMLTSMEPLFEYSGDSNWSLMAKNEEEEKIFTTVAAVMERATCLFYMSTVGKRDDEMVLSLKNSLSHLIIEEAQIMKMYLVLGTYSFEKLESHISMSLRLLKWNKKCHLGLVLGGGKLEDHFMSIEHGLQFLITILGVSENEDLKLRIQDLVATVKRTLYSLPRNQEDENLTLNLEHAYGELREEMVNVIRKPGTDDHRTLFPEIFKNGYCFSRTQNFLLEKIRKLVTSSCKADKVAPLLEELEKVRKKLESLERLFIMYADVKYRYFLSKDKEKVMAALTTFLDRTTCLIYLTIVGKLDEDMLVSLRKHFSLLINETEIKKMFLILGIICQCDWEADIDINLSLLKRQEEYRIGTVAEAMLEDHTMSLKHGIELLSWLPHMYSCRHFTRRIILLAENVKQKLGMLTYKQAGESLNMDVNGAYDDLREEMKFLIISQTTDKYDILFPSLDLIPDFRVDSYFLVEKISTLVSSNCKANQIAPLKKDLQDLRKMLTYLKPLCPYNCDPRISTLHLKAICLIYLSFVGKMDIEMALLVKSSISTAINETDVLDIYTLVLNKFTSKRDYDEVELYLLENLMVLLELNAESLDDANFKLHDALRDIHGFLLALSPSVILRKLHFLKGSFEDILGHSIPIIYSCYLEHSEVDIAAKLNCVLDLIKYIKCEVLEVKIYYFPRVDDFGFLEFFSGYLEDLTKNQEKFMGEKIDAVHFEVQSLLSLPKVTNEEHDKKSWYDIINLAYQAEYIVDLFLVSSSNDSRLVSSLSVIIEQLRNIRVDLNIRAGMSDAITGDLYHLCKSLPAQDSAVTTTQLGDNDAIMGLQADARIIQYLLEGENKLEVVSIVGMAGVGKTTLALTLYNTPSMADHFDILAWCTVSQSYQNRDLLLSILDQVNAPDKSHRSKRDDEDLADHFCRSLKKRRYLIVLDDIWDTTLWNYLKRYLPDDRTCSRILITTRNRDIADQILSKVNELHGLSDEKSWDLFEKKMVEKESLPDVFSKISKEIVEKCKGLPLSIVIIAGILSTIERTVKTWNKIAESVSSFVLLDPEGNCKAILELSYNHLPDHLRSCFLYLGSFEEDQEISVNRLINLWIGEGFVRDTKSYSAEEVAKKYVEDLIVKSLVIPSKERSGGGVQKFRLHDLLRDFCLDKAKEKHLFTLLDKKNYYRPLQDPRRLFINGVSIEDLHFSCHSIRSLICCDEVMEIEKKVDSYDMVLLKVLEVKSNRFPNISSLVHLRYLALGLDIPKVSEYPSSISKLQNLQILILRCRYFVMKVPDSIWGMVKLRHVHISETASFEVDNDRHENSSSLLQNLRSLSNARVSRGDSKWLSMLPGLQKLRCVLWDDDEKDNRFQLLSFNDHLTSLKVEYAARWKRGFARTIQLPRNLRELTLSQFFLTSSDISEIGRGLPHLEVFKIYSWLVPSKYDEWRVADEDFPGLKVLKLKNLEIAKWTASADAFPCLEQLWVESCNYLDKIPLDFGYLLKLRLISVRRCASSVDDSAREIEKLQHEEQNTDMKVQIYPRK